MIFSKLTFSKLFILSCYHIGIWRQTTCGHFQILSFLHLLTEMGSGKYFCYWRRLSKVCVSPIFSFNDMWHRSHPLVELHRNPMEQKLKIKIKIKYLCNSLLDKADCFSERNSNPTGFLESKSASVCFSDKIPLMKN